MAKKKYQFIDINGMKKFLGKINEKYSTKAETNLVDQKITDTSSRIDTAIETVNQKIVNEVTETNQKLDGKVAEFNQKLDEKTSETNRKVDSKALEINNSISTITGNITTINQSIEELRNSNTSFDQTKYPSSWMFLKQTEFTVPEAGIYKLTMVGGGGGAGAGGQYGERGSKGGSTTFVCGDLNYSCDGGYGGPARGTYSGGSSNGQDGKYIIEGIKAQDGELTPTDSRHQGKGGKGFGASGGGGCGSRHYHGTCAGHYGGTGELKVIDIYLKKGVVASITPGAGGLGGRIMEGHEDTIGIEGGRGGNGSQGVVILQLLGASYGGHEYELKEYNHG